MSFVSTAERALCGIERGSFGRQAVKAQGRMSGQEQLRGNEGMWTLEGNLTLRKEAKEKCCVGKEGRKDEKGGI